MHIAQNSPQDQTDRLLWSCGEIGRALGLNRRCTLRLLQRSYLPAEKCGVGWVVSSARAPARPRRPRRRASTTWRLSLQSVSCHKPQGSFWQAGTTGGSRPPAGPC
jgi:hypothetical protein